MIPSAPSLLAWRRARKVRAQSGVLRARSDRSRERAETVLGHLIENIRRADAHPFGDRGDVFSLRLALVPQSVGLARQSLGRWLERSGVPPEHAIDILLACSEACSNAVEHPGATSRSAFEVKASQERGVLELAVRDFGSWNERVEDDGLRGRGLLMIRALMDTVEVVTSSEGTRIVMRRRFDNPPCTKGRSTYD